MAAAIVLQTQDNCPPGLLDDWASRRRVALDVLRVDRWERLPRATDYDLAVVLGSTRSLTLAPEGWVARLLNWICEADATAVPILGICFGAQALARALGGQVVALGEPERAWIEVDTRDAARVPAGPRLSVHEDTIVLPRHARPLAGNARGVQAFAIDGHVGVQFHPEATPAIVARWVSDYGPRVGRELLVDLRARCRAAAPAALALFDAFAAGAALQALAT
jgi:GMP synthase-like glutamine amidotransferase